MTNPWKTLRETRDVYLRMQPLPDSVGGGAYFTDGTFGTILLDPRLNQAERSAVLAHELEHHRTGGGCGDPTEDWRNCERIWNRVADQLVSPATLRAWWVRAEELGDAVTPDQVAEWFHVPQGLAERAMTLLLARLRDDIEARRAGRENP